jgi:flagellar hook assembly protein FlgD
MDRTTMRVTATGLIRFGWAVQPMSNGAVGATLRSGGANGRAAAFTWDGKNSAGAVVPDGSYRITIWTADASNNRASASKVVTVDRRPAAVSLTSAPRFISPNGDGHSDRTTISMRADESITGSARMLDSHGVQVRKWAFTKTTAGSWVWDGRDSAGRTVRDGRYTLRVRGADRAGNVTVRDLGVTVDRTIRSVTWSRTSFTPKTGQTARIVVKLQRHARVTLSIDSGSAIVRAAWQATPLDAGTYGWTWNGRTTSGALLKAGTYRAVVTATSAIGSSTFTKTIVVRAP